MKNKKYEEVLANVVLMLPAIFLFQGMFIAAIIMFLVCAEIFRIWKWFAAIRSQYPWYLYVVIIYQTTSLLLALIGQFTPELQEVVVLSWGILVLLMSLITSKINKGVGSLPFN